MEAAQARHSSRNMAVASALNGRGFGALLFDLLTAQEEADRANVFDIVLLAERLVDTVVRAPDTIDHRASYRSGWRQHRRAAAALVAAARVQAIS
jgi:putative phosphoribosyl transferase